MTYTIGCSISTLVYLHKFRGDQDMLDKALELALAATNPGGAFYDGNGNWNNNLEYVHLLFAGFADAFRLSDLFGQYRDEVVKQRELYLPVLARPQGPVVVLYSDCSIYVLRLTAIASCLEAVLMTMTQCTVTTIHRNMPRRSC